METTNPTQRPKCDHPKCDQPAAWRYEVITLYGIRFTVACQGHVTTVREYHRLNILSVDPVR